MEVDAPADASASLHARALSLCEAESRLTASLDAAQLLLAREPPLPAAVDTDAVLEYARVLARTGYAPPGWPHNVAGWEPRRHCAALYACLAPPLPTERELMAAALHTAPQPPGLAAHAPAVTVPLPSAAVAEQPQPPGAAAAQQPPALPPMPKGWRPGDPLPPFTAVAAGPGMAAPPAQQPAPAQPPAEDTRYVPRAALDVLNPDLEDEMEFEVVDDAVVDDESDSD